MYTFSVYCDPKGMKELCDLSPYNLKKDLKDIEEDELNSIMVNVANELCCGPHRPPVSSMMYWGKERKAAYGKIRVVDIKNDSGKSGGYRCVVLVDMMNYRGFILHIYKHGKKRDDDIGRDERKKLSRLVDEYVESIK